MKETNPSICAVCHGNGGGCCRIEPGYETFMFGLLPGEVERISLDTGMDAGQFTVEDVPRHDFVQYLFTWFPPQAEILRNGTRTRLLINNGACVFLTESGCLLSESARPYYCRLYPFWFDSGDNMRLTRSDGCLVQQGAVSLFGVAGKLGTNREELLNLWKEYWQMVSNQER